MKTRGASKRSTRKPKNNRQLVKTIKRVIHSQAEMKNAYEQAAYIATASGIMAPIFDVSPDQGIGDDDRIGDEIRLKHLYINMRCSQNGTSSPDVIRVIFFRWKANDGVAPVYDDILETNSGTAYYSAMSQYTNKHTEFVPLKDIYFSVGTNTNIRTYRFKINLRNVMQEWIGTGSSATKTNGLYVLVVCEDTTNATTVQCNYRLTYYDI